MTVEANFQTEVRQLLRDRALDVARELVVDQGWSAVNMSLIAKRVGVSRTALYKSVGAREELATALIQRETDRYLDRVTSAITAADDAVSGLGAAARAALVFGAGNELLKSILSGAPGSGDDLLPLLTTDPLPVIGRAVVAVQRALAARWPDGAGSSPGTVEVFVRLTISHLLAPSGSIDVAVDQIHRTVSALRG
jgi:AcrR family transcriptional regulator